MHAHNRRLIMRWIHSLSLAVAAGAGLTLGGLAQAPGVADGDREVLETLEKLARAFGAGDAKAVAALWSEKAEYLSEDDGERLEGRAAIAADYAASLDKNAQARLEIDVG